MGCDIHAYLEVRRFKYDDVKRENGMWINADKWSIDAGEVLYGSPRIWHVDHDDQIWASRWYFLFAILAGVRNAWDIQPISEPKGFPDDASPQAVKEKEYWDCDGHSHSWLTMREIIDWNGWDNEGDNGKARREILSEFWERTIGRMQTHLTQRITTDDVRMVFWFDN